MTSSQLSDSLSTSVKGPIHMIEPVHTNSAITTTTTEKSQRVRRRVSFRGNEIVGSSSEIYEDDRDDVWYRHSELVQFKDDARNLSRQIRGVCDLVEADQPLLDTRIDLALQQTNNCSSRGLENRVSLERQRNKLLATRVIVKAQERYANPEELAMLASKCTAWAKEVALCTGYQDFYQVYNPTMVHLVPNTMSSKFPFDTKRSSSSRRQSDSSSSSMKKRRIIIGQDNIPSC